MRVYSPDELNAMADEDRKVVLASDFGRSFHVSAAEHVAWLFWTKDTSEPTDILGQGSAFILDCGEGPLLVTAAHVYQGYRKHQSLLGALYLQVCNAPVGDLTKYLIDCGDFEHGGPDIATFRLPDRGVASIGKKPVLAPGAAWGPEISVGEKAMHGGFPADARIFEKADEISFGFYSGFGAVTSITQHQITSRFQRENWIDVHGLGLPPAGYPLGGVSGGPLLIPDFQNGAWTWRLGGVISEAPEGKPEADVLFESIVAHRAEYISADGKLAKLR